MKKVCFLLAVLLCSSSAVAQSLTEKTGLNSVFGVAPGTADFLREAAISDQFEIQSSQLAQEEHTASLQGFASRMITDHQATSGQLQDGDLQIDRPTALDSSHQEVLDRLRKLHGNNFVGRYRSDQISAHESAISFSSVMQIVGIT